MRERVRESASCLKSTATQIKCRLPSQGSRSSLPVPSAADPPPPLVLGLQPETTAVSGSRSSVWPPACRGEKSSTRPLKISRRVKHRQIRKFLKSRAAPSRSVLKEFRSFQVMSCASDAHLHILFHFPVVSPDDGGGERRSH